MADEAVIIELLGNEGDPQRYTVADNVGIIKGATMKMTDERNAAQSDGAGDVVAGIAASEKVANDGSTSLACLTNCIVDLKVESGKAGTLGKFARTAATANQVENMSTLDHENGKALGKFLGDGSASETVSVRVLL